MNQIAASDIVEKIWEKMGPSVFLSRQDFINGLVGWEITPREVDGHLVAATLSRGPEFHFVSFGRRKALPSTLIAECLQPIIDQQGYVVTRTPKEDVRQRRFNELIGFCAVSEDEFYVNFQMEKLNLHRGNSCPS